MSRAVVRIVIAAMAVSMTILYLLPEQNRSLRTDLTAQTKSLSLSKQSFPQKIWQTSKDNIAELSGSNRALVQTWLDLNPNWRYEALTEKTSETYVLETFKDRPDIVDVFMNLSQPILKADFVRYLALCKSGGLYSDLDTRALQPIDDWIPEQDLPNVNLVIGIEYDILDGVRWPGWSRDVQFTSWTILAKPQHPLLELVIHNVMEGLRNVVAAHNTILAEFKPTFYEVLDNTGPAMFTDTAYEYFSRARKQPYTWHDFTNLTEPVQIEDILILPVMGFACGQGHSHSWPCYSSSEALVEHRFKGSWKIDHPLPKQDPTETP